VTATRSRRPTAARRLRLERPLLRGPRLPQEWQRYVHNLVAYPGCGRFDRTATRVLREDGA
jgi:hypothetical protein